MDMTSLINTASSSFNTAFGISWSAVVDFMKTQLTLIIGSGLGILQTLMPYIIGLAVISAIVYFLYRAFRFFRH